MAYLVNFECTECGLQKQECDPTPVGPVLGRGVICAACRHKIADRERRTYLASLTGLTLEERIQLIEEQLYDQNAGRRLAALEAKNTTY